MEYRKHSTPLIIMNLSLQRTNFEHLIYQKLRFSKRMKINKLKVGLVSGINSIDNIHSDFNGKMHMRDENIFATIGGKIDWEYLVSFFNGTHFYKVQFQCTIASYVFIFI